MDGSVDGPRLCLRGGGASSKRKDARKRKFDQLNEPIATETRTSDVDMQDQLQDQITTVKDPKIPSKKSRSMSIEEPCILEEVQPFRLEDNARHTGDYVEAESDAGSQTGSAAHNGEKPSQRSQRFIVFVALIESGNLPFTANQESIHRHFTSLHPSSVRHCTEKGSGRSKGFAFLEFSNYDRMKTCLKTFHHALFNDNISPPRKLNVELTAGGGGSKSSGRRLKLKARNEKLTQERARRKLEQKKIEKKSKEAKTKKPQQNDESVVHPSRKAQVPALR
ncbi:MAG: hypothetical protein Q9174_001883 [Haloplaca sp. 1 TL-2023]